MSTRKLEPLYPCGECGMPVKANEYHPYAACLMFTACHNSVIVQSNLKAVIDHGRAKAAKIKTI